MARFAGWIAIIAAFAAASIVHAAAPAQAKRLLEQGRIDAARSELESYVARNPDDAEALVLLGKVTFDGAKSQEYYRRAIHADSLGPSGTDALLAIAQYYYALGYYANAQRLAQQVTDEHPDHEAAEGAQLVVGRSLVASGQDSEAVPILAELSRSPDPSIRLAAIGAWAEALLADDRAQEVIDGLSSPAWRSYPYEMSLLTEAYRDIGDRKQWQDNRWRGVMARRAWASEPLHAPAPPPQRSAAATAPAPAPTATPSPARSTPAPQPAGEGGAFAGGPLGYSLQAGAFGSLQNAERLRDKLRAAGFESIIHRTGSLHRVWAGNYATIEAARADIARVKAASGLEPAIVRNR